MTLMINEGSFDGKYLSLKHQINEQAILGSIDEIKLIKLVISGWENAVEKSPNDGVLTDKEELCLMELMKLFSLSQTELDENGVFAKVIKDTVLRDIFEGKIILISKIYWFFFKKKKKM